MTFGTFLDDFQASVIVNATQAQETDSQITAPRVTLFNGQRAFVLVATTQAYVSDLTPVVGSNAVGFNPTISTVQSGVLLDVQATVSADRKYVTLTLRPQLSNLLALVPFTITSLVTPVGTVVGNGNPTISTGTVQQPEVQITQVNTTVSVPDGGTLLLGGQTSFRRNRTRNGRSHPEQDPVPQAALHQPRDVQGRSDPADPGQADHHHPTRTGTTAIPAADDQDEWVIKRSKILNNRETKGNPFVARLFVGGGGWVRWGGGGGLGGGGGRGGLFGRDATTDFIAGYRGPNGSHRLLFLPQLFIILFHRLTPCRGEIPLHCVVDLGLHLRRNCRRGVLLDVNFAA